MIRFGAHLSGLERRLLNQLAQSNAAAAVNSLRLATGKKINAPSDDPAAFFQISSLESRLSAITDTVTQISAASNVASQLQLTFDQVRTQLNTARTALVTDDGSSQTNVDAAISQINTLAATEINGRRLVDGSANFRFSGLSNSQIRDLSVFSVAGASQVVAPQQAELVYTGATRQITDTANITITGTVGSTIIAVAQNDTIQSLADTINSRTLTTGVSAVVEADVLRIRSVGFGSDDSVQVVVNSGTFNVTGGDGLGTATGVDAVQGTSPSVSGTVLTAAGQGSLTYTGSGGQITSTATFTLTGKRGTTAFTVTANDLLTDTADTINAESHTTGITASVNGDNLVFTTVDYGTRATIDVTVSSGTFTVTGGNGDGATAQGVDAVAQINGLTLIGDQAATLLHTQSTGLLTSDATFTLTGNLGSFVFNMNQNDSLQTVADAVNAEQTTTGVRASVSSDGLDLTLSSTTRGADAAIQVVVGSGSFDVAGGNGDGTADGSDGVPSATAVDGNRFSFNEAGLHVIVEFAAGFTGDFNTVTISDESALTFALTTSLNHTTTLGVPGILAAQLGGISGTLNQLATGGSLAGLGTNRAQAIRVVDEALSQLTLIEGRVDGFANGAVASSSALFSGFKDTLESDSDSNTILDLNEANLTEESLLLTKNQDLALNALSSLTILNQQRSSIVTIIKQIAGLI